MNRVHMLFDNDRPSYEVKNPCFLCRLPFKEDSLGEGEWVCHEYDFKL